MFYSVPIRDYSGVVFDSGFVEISAASYESLISSLRDKGHVISEMIEDTPHFFTRIVCCDRVPVCYIDKHIIED